jgi:hypothetical protein
MYQGSIRERPRFLPQNTQEGHKKCALFVYDSATRHVSTNRPKTLYPVSQTDLRDFTHFRLT